MILIGLTGGIACGKSSVSKLLAEEHHIEIIDADLIVRELQAPNAPCTRQIAARWPHCVDPATGELLRPAMARLVFSDAQVRKELGKIMNPAIFRAIMKRIVAAWWRDVKRIVSSHPPSIVVLDAPTLLETKTFTYFVSNSVVVSCSEERQIERLRRRNNFSKEEAVQRIQSQMPLSVKRQLAGYVIENDSADDFDALRGAVQDCVGWMSQQSSLRLSYMFGGVVVAGVSVVAVVCYVGVKLFAV
ncbi:putative mitochondrial Dephospho-CoA kinase [Leptomonas pyrrhocoris]|uniref:Putative mitochondrial Dephospho-CoA kinase n=1 Tax=Leptomonas pyrrhocoris TaxID=157538 RepID=A0A0M9GA21_LEPPY|nr:putative mitochondrial Dephospho-CoA kinase [Leptomonas pyrrhocoris]KPA85809.1 putative mitochondrial Dephospho-CoA kinase [Leptomonas pyrrhocoris]|eukprot:XP_015664248.1 putative mitochondrial Dephospho-CoA kinase [Leptomonas pyrrhocoris]